MAIGAHQLVAACHVLLTACNSAMGELSHDPLALLHDWTIEPPNLIEDNTWKSTPAPEAKPSSSYATQILKEPDTELEARRKGLGVSSMIMNHDAPSLPLPSGETHFGRAFDYQELTGRNIGVHTKYMDHFPTYNHPSASVLAPTTPLTEDHPNVYSSKTQMNGLVDSTSLDRKWKPVSQSVGPSAHDSGSLPETAAHAIKHRKIFKFPFALAPSNPPLGSKKPKLDQPPINFELRPRIKNEPGVIDHDSTSSHPNLRFSGEILFIPPREEYKYVGYMNDCRSFQARTFVARILGKTEWDRFDDRLSTRQDGCAPGYETAIRLVSIFCRHDQHNHRNKS
ncbi:uncharacterized protein PGTG_07193 [Puccinia graminis f. sp. tritici CRL 75-36-700-3]|uniref:Uncharacterized protein n=1 Tax=Puccinia graminis f. sp. tritici (strain CRL 75-36-700-3 / race SCCL) TaxID=418459 RepID=E3K9S8_PUCGT|nr:uncharacterized protein PGTG_07193 [Puccinia graminis f. sp. tritici CRL 75-36-700-3]EFP80941.2 hypothetical protein PGTG_07193 [Puccinia graminis f. sp. tritici CRL 75-36-700-3]